MRVDDCCVLNIDRGGAEIVVHFRIRSSGRKAVSDGVVSKRWYHRGTCEGFEGRRESMESLFCHVGEVGDDREGGIKVSRG